MRTIFVILAVAVVLPSCGPRRAPDSTLNNAAALKVANAARAKSMAEQDAIEEKRQLEFVKQRNMQDAAGPAAASGTSAAAKKDQDRKNKPPS
jgi:hypothetical protein